MMTGLVSVIVPAYNYGRYLQRLFESLLNQTYPDWECILVDNGSNDDTRDIALSFGAKDARIRYVFCENTNPAAARNEGVRHSKGEYVQFVDADDFIAEDKFRLQVQLLSSNPLAGVVYSGYYFVNESLSEEWNDKNKWLRLSDNPFSDFVNYWEAGLTIPVHCFLFRKISLEKFGLFDISLRTHEDWDLHISHSLRGLKYIFHEYKGAFYRIHPKSSSRVDLTLNRKDMLDVLAKYFNSPYTGFTNKRRILNRYFELFALFVTEKIRFNNLVLARILKNKMGVIVKGSGLLLLPFYILKLTARRFTR